MRTKKNKSLKLAASLGVIADYTDQSSNKVCFDIRSSEAVDPTLVVQSIRYVLPDDGYLSTIPDPGYDLSWPGFIKP
jgi:hypothetical protein